MTRLLAAISITCFGCGTPSVIDGPIDYRSAGGISGTGDGTGLLVELDGRATRIHPDGNTEIVLEPATLEQLHDAIYDALPLAGTFGPCCDFYTDDISVQLDGQVQMVSVADVAENVPGDLQRLIDLLRLLAAE